MAALSNPFQKGSGGWGVFIHQNHGTGGGNGSIMVVVFVCLCLASKKPSEREFFVPAGTDLSVKLLMFLQPTRRSVCSLSLADGFFAAYLPQSFQFVVYSQIQSLVLSVICNFCVLCANL
jgi:hypothetical protein